MPRACAWRVHDRHSTSLALRTRVRAPPDGRNRGGPTDGDDLAPCRERTASRRGNAVGGHRPSHGKAPRGRSSVSNESRHRRGISRSRRSDAPTASPRTTIFDVAKPRQPGTDRREGLRRVLLRWIVLQLRGSAELGIEELAARNTLTGTTSGFAVAEAVTQYVPAVARFSKRVFSPRKASRTMPIGPLRCLLMMISATPLSCVSSL